MVMPVDNRAKSNKRLVMQQRLQAIRVSSSEHSSSASVTIIICLKYKHAKALMIKYNKRAMAL